LFYDFIGSRRLLPRITSAPHLIGDPLSNYVLERIRFRMNYCISQHRNCSSEPGLLPVSPKRLVDIGNPENTSIRLVSEPERCKYFTLSYCWGVGNPLRTTKANLPSMEGNIPWDSLSKSFRDAVRVTRALGSRYLWIDSLCILQDDDEDWRTESAKMGDIYGASELTIVATRAASCDEGFLQPRREGVCVLSCMIHGEHLEVWARTPNRHGGYLSTVPHTFSDCPIFKRGWCFQERLLSRRTLHFAHQEVFFQCRTEDWCECHGNAPWGRSWGQCDSYYASTVSRFSRRIADARLDEQEDDQVDDCHEDDYHSDDSTGPKGLLRRICFPRASAITEDGEVPLYLGRVWNDIVSEYSHLSLSFAGDILPALSGIAKTMSELLHCGRYFGGIWERDIHYFLAWSSLRDEGRCFRPREYTAPSFSWASRIGPVYFPFEELITSVTTIIEVKTIPKGKDAYGQLRGGFITLRGKLVPIRRERDPTRGAWQFRGGVRTEAKTSGHFEMDTEEDYTFLDDGGGNDLYGLELYRESDDSRVSRVAAIILTKVDDAEQAQTFRRIGITGFEAVIFDQVPATIVTIV